MANGANPTLEGVAMRLDWLEKERLARIETNVAQNLTHKAELERESDRRAAGDQALEVAIKDMREDIQTIKNNTTWALRTVAGTMFVAIASFIVNIAGGA